MCIWCSTRENLNKNRHTEQFQTCSQSAVSTNVFCIQLCKFLNKDRRYFLHEHPKAATSWKTDPTKHFMCCHVMKLFYAMANMCAFNMTQQDQFGEGFIYKPTCFMTNSLKRFKQLGKQWLGKHRHIHLMNGRAAKATVYTDELCNYR